jgi:hypothetical protein
MLNSHSLIGEPAPTSYTVRYESMTTDVPGSTDELRSLEALLINPER